MEIDRATEGLSRPTTRRRGLALAAVAAAALLAAAAAPRVEEVTAFPGRLVSRTGHSPALAIDGQGRAVVAWVAPHDISGGQELGDVLAQRLRGDALVGAPFPVHEADGDGHDPRVAMDSRGGFAVVWQEGIQPGGSEAAIRAQLFRADGRRRNGPLGLSPRGIPASHPEVGMAPDGRFAVAWEQGGDPARAVRLATFDSGGGRLARPRVMSAAGETANLVGAVSAGAETVSAAWTEVTPCPAQPLDPVSAVATFDWSLAPVGEVDRFANDNPCIDGPQVLAMPGSDFGPLGIFVGRRYSIQRFSPLDGQRAGPRINIADLPPCDAADCQRAVAVAGDRQGRFVLVWERLRHLAGKDTYDLFVELYGREGERRNAAFKVNDAPSSRPHHPSAALGNDGTLLVAWQRARSGIVLRRLHVP